MKKAILLLLLSCSFSIAKELPVEKTLIEGKLKNGLQYTILQNSKPQKRAELKLLVKVGSLEEEDDQQGVAHFIEHMAFNGSKHFKKNELIAYLESIGVKFGNDLNANTSYEQTVYMLTIPLEKDNLKKSFLVFSDWASGLNFDVEEFNKERGVVLEEERLRNNIHLRLFQQYKDLLFGNSPYLHREPIGKKEVIKTISVKRAKEFYDTWYRPELMHFIAVGDFNTTEVEGLIATTFSKLENKNHKKITPRVILENNTTRIKTVWDAELTSNYLSVYYMDKLDNLRTEKDLRGGLRDQILSELFKEKANEQIEKNHPKATVINFRSDQLNHNRGYYKFLASYKGEDELLALKELYELMWSIEKYGFSQDALQRIKGSLLAKNAQKFHRAYEEKSLYLSSLVLRNILSNSIFIDYAFKYSLKKRLINEISIEEINKHFRKILNFQDRIIIFKNNTSKSYSKEQVLSVIEKAKKNLHNWKKEKKLPKDLLINRLKRKNISEKKYNQLTDIYQFTLANGVKVAFKQSNFSKDKVFLKGFSFGGESLYDADQLLNIRRASLFVTKSGVRELSSLDLEKILLNRDLKFSSMIEARTEEINTEANIKDVDQMFALLYLKLTQAQIDKNISKNIKNILKIQAKKALNNPKEKFYREMQKYYYKDNPRIQFETPKSIDDLNESSMLSIYNDRFSDFNNFAFMIVGDISLEKVEELSQKYLANLPVLKRSESFIKRELPYRKDHVVFRKNYNTENISNITLKYKSSVPYSERTKLVSDALQHILGIRLRKLIREDHSAVYHIRTHISLDLLEKKSIGMIAFACDPKRKDELLKMLYASIEEIKIKPVTHNELAIYKKSFTTYEETALKENRYWMYNMEKFYKKGIPLENIYKYSSLVKEITAKEVLDLANQIFSKDWIQMELNPKN